MKLDDASLLWIALTGAFGCGLIIGIAVLAIARLAAAALCFRERTPLN
jgi:hypothetical protein